MCLPNAERRTTEAKPVEICRSDIGWTHGSAPTIGRVEHMRNLNNYPIRKRSRQKTLVDNNSRSVAIALRFSDFTVSEEICS